MTDKLKNYVYKLARGGVAEALLAMWTGQTVAQIIQLTFIPFITRLYSPVEYGEFSLFALGASLGAVLCSLRYELALVVEEDDTKAKNLFALILTLSTVTAIILCAALFWLGEPICSFFSDRVTILTLVQLVMAMWMQSLLIAISYWLLRFRAFALEGKSRVLLASLVGLGQVGFSFVAWDNNGLISGYLAGNCITLVILSLFVFHNYRLPISRLRFSSMKDVAVRYKKFPQFSTWDVVANKGALLLPLTVLTHSYGATVGGFFALARNVYNIPLSVVSEPASRVFFVQAKEMFTTEQSMSQLSRKWILPLIVGGCFILGAIALVGPHVFGLIFGGDWQEAGKYLWALLPITMARFAVVPIMPILNVVERQDINLGWQIGLVVIVFIGFSGLSRLYSPFVTIIATGVAVAMWYAGLALWLCSGTFPKGLVKNSE